MWNPESRPVKYAETITTIMNCSEVACHLGVAGRIMKVKIVGNEKYPMAQLINPLDDREYSFPITLGEANIYPNEKPKKGYYYYPAPEIRPKT